MTKVNQKINLEQIEKLIDKTLDNETEESLTKWLLNKRSKNTYNLRPQINIESTLIAIDESWDDIFTIIKNPDASMGTKEAMIRERYNHPTKK